MASALKQTKYWYKIGKKAVTKEEYNKYENPVGDGPTKTTNDPDASGNKAKIAKNREKLRKPTVLTKKQMELKDQGTKLPTKNPPFNYKNTPLNFGESTKDSIKSDKVRTDIKIISDDDQKIIDRNKAIKAGQERQKNSKVEDTTKRNVKRAVQSNALARLFSGITPKGV
tara:strand:+ start:270 stop:779 length:510 start_codon:yes stop_codon:yes gene_type:complete